MRSKERVVLIGYFALLMCALVWTVVGKKSMAVPFLVALTILPFILILLSYPAKRVFVHLVKSVFSYRKLFTIISLMGVTIGLWLFSGVVPSMIYFSMGLLTKLNIVLMCFWITCAFSFVIGTALGTISTFGIALLAIGTSVAVPPPIMLGAIVSGSYIADRLSPVGGLVNLNLAAHGTAYGAFLKASRRRLAVAFVIASVAFYMLGLPYDGSASGDAGQLVLNALSNVFTLSSWMLLVPVFVIVLSLLKTPIVLILSGLAALCGGIAYFVQGETLQALIQATLWGFKTTDVVLMSMLKGGGLIPFMEVVTVVACAIGISSLFELTDTYRQISSFFLSRVKDERTLRKQIGLMSLALTSATCDQTLGIVTPAQLYKDKAREYNVDPAICAAAVADTGVIIAPLEPWNVNTLVITAMTGISVFEYGRFTVFLIVLIILYFVEAQIPKGMK